MGAPTGNTVSLEVISLVTLAPERRVTELRSQFDQIGLPPLNFHASPR
ncbi:MAG: hypothetical protein M3314_05715 [Actinomycetota bacterium]|nr:hypothetical protein [Actinomycetota bacterium]